MVLNFVAFDLLKRPIDSAKKPVFKSFALIESAKINEITQETKPLIDNETVHLSQSQEKPKQDESVEIEGAVYTDQQNEDHQLKMDELEEKHQVDYKV